MTQAFKIRRRSGDPSEQELLPGSEVVIDERHEYLLRFSSACPPEAIKEITDLGGEMLSPDTALLGFLNFVGEANVAGVTLHVSSSKVGEEGVSRLLEDVSTLASNLVFAHGSPTTFSAEGTRQEIGPIPYHQLQYIRRSMLSELPGARLQDWLALIERNPTRNIERERPVLPVGRVRRLDHRAVTSIFQRLDRIMPVPAGSAIAANRLAIALTFGTPPSAHFPYEVASPRGKLSFDTPENRFVRHVVEMCLSLIYRFVDHPKLHGRLRADCRTMLSSLEEISAQPFLREAGRITSLTSPSQALAKNDGYREVLGFWLRLQESMSLPSDPEEAARMLEGRDVARLYEYWVFLKVLEAVVAKTGFGPDSPPQIHRNELGESLVVGVPTQMGGSISVRYNASFLRSQKTAYSTPLRPDVVLSVGTRLFAFDAKYRLDALLIDENDSDEGKSTYKRADLYKMHTYRDAIHSMEAAFVVYPGSEFAFFDRSRGFLDIPDSLENPDGVGAIPLRPSNQTDTSALHSTIGRLLAP